MDYKDILDVPQGALLYSLLGKDNVVFYKVEQRLTTRVYAKPLKRLIYQIDGLDDKYFSQPNGESDDPPIVLTVLQDEKGLVKLVDKNNNRYFFKDDSSLYLADPTIEMYQDNVSDFFRED